MKRIVIYGKFSPGMIDGLMRKCPQGFEAEIAKSDSPSCLSEADYVVCRAIAMDAGSFTSAPKVKFLQKWGAGFDKIDIQSIGSLNIPVSVCLGGNSEPVAELTVGLMLSVLRNICPLMENIKKGIWERERYAAKSFLLNGKKIGLLGIGNIAKKVARILIKGFNCDVSYFDVMRLTPEQEKEYGVSFLDLETLLRTSDIVSIHVPLLESTKGMINAEKLRLMKNSSFLINTSRGGIVNEADLIAALKDGTIMGAGLDTYEKEPLDRDSDLLKLDNVVATPHCGGNTVDNDINMASICMENIACFDRTQNYQMRSIVNKEFLLSNKEK